MNIAFYSHYFSPEIGAPSARIRELSRRWIELGHNIEVVTCFPNHPDGELYPGYQLRKYRHEMMEGIGVHRNWTYITPNEGIIKKTLGHLSLWPSSRIFTAKKLDNPDVVIGTSPTFFAAMAARGVAKQRRVPFIMEVRDLWPGLFVELGVITNKILLHLLETWELWLYRKAEKIITVTEGFRDDIVGRGIDGSKVHVIPNGADVNFWQPVEPSPGLSQRLGIKDKFVVLYIGAHGISQALDAILESAKLLSGFDDILFLFVGSGSEKEKLVEKSNREKIKNVVFHDPVPKNRVKDYYALADVCLVPLRDIPLFRTFIPSKLFEILAVGRPIVASLEGEAAMILRESGGAIVTPPEDSQAIADAIVELVEHPQRRDDMGQSGRKFVVANYSREKLARKYIKILQGSLR